MSKEEKQENKNLEFYLAKKYPILIYPSEDGGFVAEIEELPGCLTQGETLEEVMTNIEEARRLWTETTYEDGQEIPLPRTEETYSGKFVVRIPKYLHRRLVEQAKKEEVSLNQYVEALLSAGTALHDDRIDKLINEVRGLKEKLGARESVKSASNP